MELKGYQERSLEALAGYFRDCGAHGATRAFVLHTGRPYLPVPSLPALPYVCLRVPTGGGKTFMACHALSLAVKTHVEDDKGVCLWLVPSNAIREQTLAALRNRRHPYRQALDGTLPSQVCVMDLREALYVQPETLDRETAIIVSTLAALRVTDVEGRKIYESAGELSRHFLGLDPKLESLLERNESGVAPCSLANVLRLRRPVVIMDEAHNARTPLSFESLARFGPSCVVEFTATPETTHRPEQELFASNVLWHVSAAELKAEEMVKLPISLQTRGDWREVVGEAVAVQRSLEAAAREEEKTSGEYLRPIVLLQAQPRSKERERLSVEVVKRCLLDDLKVPGDQVAVATGETREIEDVDLLDRGCPIRFIITVQALKEGWDCPFAYILCSVAEIGSPRAVEQILGRILRLPRARWKKNPRLNCAYAFVASPRFIEAATALKDALVENGFEKMEANDLLVHEEQPTFSFPSGPLFGELTLHLSEAPDFSALDKPLLCKAEYDREAGTITVTGSVGAEDLRRLQGCLRNPRDRESLEREYLVRHAQEGKGRPAFSVPLLAIRDGERLQLLEESCFEDVEWNIAECDPGLSEEEFPAEQPTGEAGEVDVGESGRVELRFVSQLHSQMALLGSEPGWTSASLASWLDRQIPHPDITQAQCSLFVHSVVTRLVESRGITLEQLVRQKFRLRAAVEAKIAEHRSSNERRAYNLLLFGSGGTRIEVGPGRVFSFDENRYSPNWWYEGGFQFNKHYFPRPGELRSEGEEFECAVFLDHHPKVWHWVRNLERRPESSFWLPTATDRFYPDFVVLLTDGRILVVEYKGEDRWSNDDSKEKRAVGELWAERSGGHCLFVMPRGKDWATIDSLLSSRDAANADNRLHL